MTTKESNVSFNFSHAQNSPLFEHTVFSVKFLAEFKPLEAYLTFVSNKKKIVFVCFISIMRVQLRHLTITRCCVTNDKLVQRSVILC